MEKKFTYEYSPVINGSQYTKEELEADYVKAKYVHDYGSPGNPLVEALSPVRSGKTLVRGYVNKIEKPTAEDKKHRESPERLKDLRIALPMGNDVEKEGSKAIKSSYRERNLILVPDVSIDFFNQDGVEEYNVNAITDAVNKSASVTGFALIGNSGCGKSKTIDQFRANQPKVIIHNLNGVRFVQIPILYVVCPDASKNGGIKELYDCIGVEIDHLLGDYFVHKEEKNMKSAKTANAKAIEMTKLISKYNIGMILIDEIQDLKYDKRQESSLNALLRVNNNSNVAIAVVGTEETYKELFTEKDAIAQRIGPIIQADNYVNNPEKMDLIIQDVLYYQWFDPEIQITDELKEALIEESGGVLRRLIELYIHMNTYYIDANKKPSIDVSYVRKISKKYFGVTRNQSMKKYSIENKKLSVSTIDTLPNDIKEQKNILDTIISQIKEKYPNIPTEFIKDEFYRYIKTHPDTSVAFILMAILEKYWQSTKK